MTPWAHSGSRSEPSTTWTRIRVRSTWRRKAWPRPAPWLAPSMRPGHVGDRRAPLVLLAEIEHPEVRLEGRERVVGDLRPGRGERREEGRLARVRQPDEADVGDQPELEADPALLARLALLGVLRGPVGRRGEVDVAEPPTAAPGDHGQLLDRDEVGDELAARVVVDGRPRWDREDEIAAGLAVTARATPRAARRRLEVAVLAVVPQGRLPGIDPEVDRAAAPAVAPVRPAARDVRLASERRGAVPAVTGAHVDLQLVEEHRRDRRTVGAAGVGGALGRAFGGRPVAGDDAVATTGR